jgi:HK97 gp10 family phage protein
MKITSSSIYKPRNGGGQFVAAQISKGVREAVIEWAGDVLDTARGLVPVDTGELKASGHVTVAETNKTLAVAVSFDADHAGFIEFGTGIRGASSPGAGDGPYSPTWAGQSAQPYLRPAFDQNRSKAEAMTREKIQEALG